MELEADLEFLPNISIPVLGGGGGQSWLHLHFLWWRGMLVLFLASGDVWHGMRQEPGVCLSLRSSVTSGAPQCEGWWLRDCVDCPELCKLWSLPVQNHLNTWCSHGPSMFFGPCVSAGAVALNIAVVRRRQPHGRGMVPGQFGCCLWRRMGSCPMLCFHLLPSPCWGFGSSWSRGSSRLPMRCGAGAASSPQPLPVPGTRSRTVFPAVFCSGSPL